MSAAPRIDRMRWSDLARVQKAPDRALDYPICGRCGTPWVYDAPVDYFVPVCRCWTLAPAVAGECELLEAVRAERRACLEIVEIDMVNRIRRAEPPQSEFAIAWLDRAAGLIRERETKDVKPSWEPQIREAVQAEREACARMVESDFIGLAIKVPPHELVVNAVAAIRRGRRAGGLLAEDAKP